MSKSGISLFLAVVIAVGGSIWFLWRGIIIPGQPIEATSSTDQKLVTTVYQCASGATIEAIFVRGTVGLSLSDGRSFALSETTTTSGVRYTNEDGSFVFWTIDQNAFVEENGTITFEACVSADSADLPR